MILKGIQVKIYPNQAQCEQLHQWFGCQRFVWNQYLGMLNKRYQNNPNLSFPSKFDLNRLLVPLKKEYPFLKDAESSSLQQVCEKLHEAFQQFFKKMRKHPRFKTKKQHQKTITIKNNQNIQLTHQAIKLPKLGWIKARWSNHLPFQAIKRVTVQQRPSGRYVASVLVESENQVIQLTGKEVGVDVGQLDLAILSDGKRIPSLNQTKEWRRLAKWQRCYSRRLRQAKMKGLPLNQAKNLQKAKQMVAKCYEKIQHQRQNYLQQVTTWIIRHYDLIGLEDIRVKNLLSNPNHKAYLKGTHRKLAQQSWRLFRDFLTYKAEWANKQVVPVNPAYTTQDCSICGHRIGKLDCSIRQWTCPSCRTVHDRDVNAACNILVRAKQKNGQELALIKEVC